jgi:hypothetical protein
MFWHSYNAAVFQIATFNEYNIIAIDSGSEQWLQLNSSSDISNPSRTHWNLSNSNWMQTYDTKYVSEHGDLYLAVDRVAFDTSTPPFSFDASIYWPLEFAGGNQTHIRRMTSDAPNWILYDVLASSADNIDILDSSPNDNTQRTNITSPVSMHVVHAFSKIVQPQSRIQISLDFMIVVIVFNVLKLAIMTWVLVTDKRDYIVTLGDAAGSYLARPDSTTKGKCMLNKEEMISEIGKAPYYAPGNEPLIEEDTSRRARGTWLPRAEIYFYLMGKDRQVFFALLYASNLLTVNAKS